MRKLKNYKPTRFMAETSHYSKQMADFAVMFIEQLTHTKGTWAGKPFTLIDWQDSREVDNLARQNAAAYQEALDAGKPTGESVDKAIARFEPV